MLVYVHYNYIITVNDVDKTYQQINRVLSTASMAWYRSDLN